MCLVKNIPYEILEYYIAPSGVCANGAPVLTSRECTVAASKLGLPRSSNACYWGYPYCWISDSSNEDVVLHTCHSTDVGNDPACHMDCGSLTSSEPRKAICKNKGKNTIYYLKSNGIISH